MMFIHTAAVIRKTSCRQLMARHCVYSAGCNVKALCGVKPRHCILFLQARSEENNSFFNYSFTENNMEPKAAKN